MGEILVHTTDVGWLAVLSLPEGCWVGNTRSEKNFRILLAIFEPDLALITEAKISGPTK